jgi:hypothetical protein
MKYIKNFQELIEIWKRESGKWKCMEIFDVDINNKKLSDISYPCFISIEEYYGEYNEEHVSFSLTYITEQDFKNKLN